MENIVSSYIAMIFEYFMSEERNSVAILYNYYNINYNLKRRGALIMSSC